MRNWFRGLKLNQKFTVTTLIFIFIPLFGMMCFGFRSIKKNAIDHGVNEAVTAIDLTCAEVNAKANACSMVVDTLQEYEPLEKYLLHLRRGEEISESYYQQFRNNSISIIDKMQEAMPDLYQIHIFAMADGFLEQQPILYQKEKETLEVSKRESQERILNYERFLTDMVRYAASEENPDKVLNQLVEYIGQRVTADRAYIFEQNDRGTFDNTYEWCKAGVSKEKDNLQDVPYEGIIETWFAQYQESNNVIIHDIEEYKKTSEAIYELLKPQGVNTLVTGPIKINGKMVGFYGVDNPPEEKLHEISNEIDMIEFMISFMIRLRDNADALEHSALYDQLTDCKNRKALDWAYTEKLEKYFPLAVVLCDLNGLKEINDQKGHDAGDKFIVQTAQTLKSVFGKRYVYRFGGDEFIAVLPNITHPAFQKLLETAKSQLGATASLGTTISGTKDTDFESLLKAADAEMYENKKQYYIVTGKDRGKHSL